MYNGFQERERNETRLGTQLDDEKIDSMSYRSIERNERLVSPLARKQARFKRCKGQKSKDRVQELYRPKRSILGYKLLDYNVLSMSRMQVMVQVK